MGAQARKWVHRLESGCTAYILGAVPRKWVQRLESGCTAYILGAVPRKWVQGLDVSRTEVWVRSIRAASHVIFVLKVQEISR